MPIASIKDVLRAQEEMKAKQKSDVKISEEDSKKEKAILAFIKGAPDGNYQEPGGKKHRHLRGKKTVITINIDPDLLDEFDEWCESIGMNRTQAITMQMRKLLQKNTLG